MQQPRKCGYCGAVCTVDARGTLIDPTEGDVCTERGDDLPHEEKHYSTDGRLVTVGEHFWNNDMRVVKIAVVARSSNPYQDRCTQTWHDTTDGGMFDTLDGPDQPYGRLARWLGGKDAGKYPAGTEYRDIR